MVYYYLDIETYGEGNEPHPDADKIVCISFCAINPKTGEFLQEPTILKEWETSEEEIVKKLAERMMGNNPFDFIPTGFAILYDLWFLKHKFKKYCDIDIDDTFYMNQPYLDLKQVMVFAADGRFKGVRIGSEGNPVQDWYKFQDFESIERHAREKMEKFSEEWKRLRQ